MDEQSQESLLEMHLDYDGGNILRDTVRWSRFLSLTGLIITGIAILGVALGGSAIISIYSRTMPGIEEFAGILIAAAIFVLLIFGLYSWLLYRFSMQVKKGIETQDQALFNRGLKNLKIYFLIAGIFAILALLTNVLNLKSLF